MKSSLIILVLVTFASILSAKDTISTKMRASKAKLELKEGMIGLYVKGLICKSCGIGVKKKVSSLTFLDKSKLDRGMKVDASHQLFYIAITKGKTPNFKEIDKAVIGAGYDPVTYYFLENGKIKSKLAK